MFELLTLIILWVLIGTLIWYIFTKFISKTYLTWLGGIILFVFIVLAFFNPGDPVVSVVWSVLSFPFTPLGLSITLLLGALRDGASKIYPNLVIAALLVLVFFSIPVVSYWLAAQNEQGTSPVLTAQPIQPTARGTVRAIVVLGDGISPSDPSFGATAQFNGQQDVFGNRFVSRLLAAAQVYREQAATTPFVIVSPGSIRGVAPAEESGTSIASILTNAGVPADRVVIEPNGLDIRSSAVEIDRYLVNQGFDRQNDAIILVAPAITIRRAVSAFTRLGLQTVPRSTDFLGSQLRDGLSLAVLTDLIPNVDALALTTRVVKEYLISVYYFLRGWLYNPLS